MPFVIIIMRMTRIYFFSVIQLQQTLDLPESIIRHISCALRAKVGDAIILFNGDGYDYHARIDYISKKKLTVFILEKSDNNTAPSLEVHLAQCVCRGEKMDFVIQKATELGATEITPIVSEFGNVILNQERWQKKISHWQKIANSACEQSGRADMVTIHMPVKFIEFVSQSFSGAKLILSPEENSVLEGVQKIDAITLLVGPEGGFSENELKVSERNGFLPWQLGPRVLRSETAGLAAISVAQHKWGDF